MRTKYVTNNVQVHHWARVELAHNDESGDRACVLYAAPATSDHVAVYVETNGDPLLIAVVDASANAYARTAAPEELADEETLAWLHGWCPDWTAAFETGMPRTFLSDWPGLATEATPSA